MASWTTHSRVEIVAGSAWLYKIRYADGREPANWYYELKPESGKRVRKSAKTGDVQEAMRAAMRALGTNEARAELGLPTDVKSFDTVADEYLAELKADRETGHVSGSKLKSHEGIIENYLKEFLEGKLINEITEDVSEDYKEWRKRTKKSVMKSARYKKKIEKVKKAYEKSKSHGKSDISLLRRYKGMSEQLERSGNRVPTPSTLNTEMTVLRSVLKYARRQHYIAIVPKVNNVSLRNHKQARPAFTGAEMLELISMADTQRKTKGVDPLTTEYRNLLYYFIRIGYLTGLRTTEELCLRFHDVEPWGDDKAIVHVTAIEEGAMKTGSRTVLVSREVLELVEQLQKRKHSNKPTDYVFTHPKIAGRPAGYRIQSFKKGFEHLLSVSGLERDRNGNKRTLYSLRHTHINEMLQTGTMNLYQLAENVGNSPDIIRKFYGKGVSFDLINASGLLQTNMEVG